MATSEQLILLAKARQRAAAASAADPAAAPPVEAPPAEPSLIDTIMGGLKGLGGMAYQGGIGFSKGVSNTFGLPGDIARAVPQGVSPFTDSLRMLPTGQDVQHFFRQDTAPEPQGFAEHLVNRIGEEFGGMAVPEAGVVSSAVRMGPKAVREMSGIAKHFLEPYAVSPARAMGNDVAAATAAGTGAGLVDSIPGIDRSTPTGQWADFGGAMGGVGLAAIAHKILGATGQVVNAVRQNPNYTDQVVKDTVTDRIAKSAGLDNGTGAAMDTQSLVDAINRPNAGRAGEVIPGFQESLADRTRNPGVASLEYSRQSGPNAGDFARRRAENSDVVDAAMRNVEPVETPGVFRSALEQNRNDAVGRAALEAQGAQSQFDEYIRNLAPAMGGEERGAAVRGGLANAERAMREQEHMAWNPITGEVDPAPLAERLNAARDSLTMQRQQSVADAEPTIRIPERLSVDAEGNPRGPVPIAEINDVRSDLQRQQRDAASVGDRNKSEALNRFITETTDYLGSDAVPAPVREATANARALSRDVNERFNRPNDPIAEVLADKEGRPNVPDSAVAPKFVQPDAGQASNIDRLLAETDLTSHGRDVRAAIKDEILGQMDKKNILRKPEATDQFLRFYGRVFERYPDLHDEITQAANAGRAAGAAEEASTNLTAQLGSPDGTVKGRNAVGKYLQYSDAQPERAINEVLNSKDPGAAADELMTFIGDNPKAAEGARSAFWTKLKAESQSVDNAQRGMGGGRAWRGDWLKSFLDKPNVKAVAERLYKDNPEALAAIQKYAEVLDNVDLRQRGKVPGTSGTAQGVNPVLTPETLQSRFTSYMRGQIGGTYLVTSIAAVMARRAIRRAQTEAIDRLTDKALLSPEFAAELLKDNNPANRAALARKAKLWMGNEASTLLQLLDGEDENDGHEDEAVKAAMR